MFALARAPICLVALCFAAPVGAADPLPPAATRKIDFAKDIRPIFATHCGDCHGADLQESNYRLDVRKIALAGGDFGQPAIVPGKSAASPLIQYVADQGDITMPPEDAGEPLTAEQVGLLRAWIDQGAPWPDALAGKASKLTSDHWSLQPVAEVTPPDAADEWARNPIDRFVAARLQQSGLAPSPPADRRTLLRRLYLDMHGLPPSPEAVAEFIADPRPDAYERRVEEVLASPRYGERWAQHWLDIVRYADTHGFEVNTPRDDAWPYRDYVIQSLNEDKPYDRFVYEQLAGDRVGQDAATGFLVAAPVLLPGQIGKDEDSIKAARQDALDEIVSATGATFLGLTVGCARCHNHKFDPILQKDYYSLQAVFAGVHYGARSWRTPQTEQYREELEHVESQLAKVEQELAQFALRAPVDARENNEQFEPVSARFVRFTVDETNKYEACLDELEIFTQATDDAPARNVALASAGAKATASGTYPNSAHHRLEHINDGRYGNTRSWIPDKHPGWVQIELAEVSTIDRIVWARDRTGGYDDRLATSYRIEVAVEPDQWTTVSSSITRLPLGTDLSNVETLEQVPVPKVNGLVAERRRLRALLAPLKAKATRQVYAGIFRTPAETFRLRRGDHKQPIEQVAPDTVGVLGSLDLTTDAPESDRRHALATWLIDPANPLTARVMVNRIWHYHFGAGLVNTPSDFGTMGGTPSHPQLLDYLARQFVDSGWSIKALHRQILLSATYRQSSRDDNPAARKIDASSRLLWRFPARRLEAEAIRDSTLQVSGVLRHEMGGPGFHLFKPRKGLDVYEPKDEYGPAEWRRLIYAHKVRMAQDGVFSTFDMPDCGQLCSKRPRSTTPLQALNLFNSRFMMRQARRLAERVESDAGPDVADQVARLFQLALARAPDEEEAELSAALVRQHGLAQLCRVILNTSEFVTLP